MEELRAQEAGEFIEKLATAVRRRGWQTPVTILLEGGPPFHFFGEQVLWVAQPALSLFIPSHLVRQLAQLLAEPTAVRALLVRLNAGEAEQA
ncbi:MAG: hypothetical protein KF770_00150 [Anaerolineae bacterium]|nr:hypothetical protein [Anaerolineae bacterium]